MVFSVMVIIFVLTGFYTRSFRSERADRGQFHFENGQQQMSAQQFDAAISQYRDALLYSRDNPTYRLELSRALLAADQDTEAQTQLTGLRAGSPASGIVNLLLARLAVRQQQTDEAVSHYRMAIHGEWDGDSSVTRLDIRLELIDFLEVAGRQQQLIAELVDLAEIVPDEIGVQTRLAMLLLKSGVYDRASSLFEDLLTSNPGNRGIMLGRADAEFHLGNYLTARTHYNRAQLLAEDERTDSQIALCNQIIELDPTRRGISLAERIRRSRVLISRALAAIFQCQDSQGSAIVGPLEPLTTEQADLVDQAETAFADRQPPLIDAAVESNIQLAEDAWSLALTLCADDSPPEDTPLMRVMAKLSR